MKTIVERVSERFVREYLSAVACAFKYRGKLDSEISVLIKNRDDGTE